MNRISIKLTIQIVIIQLLFKSQDMYLLTLQKIDWRSMHVIRSNKQKARKNSESTFTTILWSKISLLKINCWICVTAIMMKSLIRDTSSLNLSKHIIKSMITWRIMDRSSILWSFSSRSLISIWNTSSLSDLQMLTMEHLATAPILTRDQWINWLAERRIYSLRINWDTNSGYWISVRRRLWLEELTWEMLVSELFMKSVLHKLDTMQRTHILKIELKQLCVTTLFLMI